MGPSPHNSRFSEEARETAQRFAEKVQRLKSSGSVDWDSGVRFWSQRDEIEVLEKGCLQHEVHIMPKSTLQPFLFHAVLPAHGVRQLPFPESGRQGFPPIAS
jgi:hypothetical protein